MRRRDLGPRFAVVVGYAVVALTFSWPLPLHLGTALTGNPGGDTGVYVWNQWVFHRELTEGHNPLATETILSLTPRVDLAQHNYTAFLDVLAAPLITAFDVITAFNLVFLIACVLNALVAYGLARRAWGAERAEAWLAGLAFAWSPVLVARSVDHFSLVAAAPLAAFLWCLMNAERSHSLGDAALLGLTVAWAAFSDAYYAVYCLMLALMYVAAAVVRVTCAPRASALVGAHARSSWGRWGLWPLDVLIVCLAGLVVGLSITGGAAFSVLGVRVSMRQLYTPTLILTVLVGTRLSVTLRPRLGLQVARVEPWVWKAALVALLTSVGPLSPVLVGLGRQIAEGQFVNPPIFWRSSPSGVDLLAFFTPNPNHPLVKLVTGDPQAAAPTVFVEYTASLSLVALGVVALAVWRAGFRPRPGWWWIAGGFAAMALGPFVHVAGYNTHVPGPWALLRYLPLVGIARMPTRFAIVVALGLAMLLAGALVAIGRQWPERRRLVTAGVAALLLFELWPAPRTLYSAAISPLYDTIANDPRPVRVLVLPFGVRDGVSSAGNFRARSQFNQTRHGKLLIGGYLSRISPRRVERMREEFPVLSALMKASQAQALDDADLATLREHASRFVDRAGLGYVVVDQRFLLPASVAQVQAAFDLRELARDGTLVLYEPELSPR